MRFSSIYIVLFLVFALSVSIASAEDSKQISVKTILENTASNSVGVSLSSESAGFIRHYFGLGTFVAINGDKNSYLLVQGNLFSDGFDNPHYNIDIFRNFNGWGVSEFYYFGFVPWSIKFDEAEFAFNIGLC